MTAAEQRKLAKEAAELEAFIQPLLAPAGLAALQLGDLVHVQGEAEVGVVRHAQCVITHGPIARGEPPAEPQAATATGTAGTAG